eukprot:CAMPEP_0118997378 /NCGR_PEP_ID=MMETSP1173-20130426/61620_1 /TAXON_ID=1034831 /ORGANISM="Rhizochromulina marina cf, Strain CCMP1243" /LENGTH=353 /DNA_ID=CAMNT_0006948825 /DNA_START=265 /DNA_END=1323 /DNA_ORIENTATION=-
MLDLGEDSRTRAPHDLRISFHHLQVCSHSRGKIRLVDDEEVRLSDPGASFSRHLVATGHVDHVNRVVRKLMGKVRCKIVSSGLDQEQLCAVLRSELFACQEVGRNILANCSMGTASGLDCPDSVRFKSLVLGQKLAVLSGKNIVCDHSHRLFVLERAAELQHQRRFAASNRATDPDREGPLVQIASLGSVRRVSGLKLARMIQMLMGVPMACVIMPFVLVAGLGLLVLVPMAILVAVAVVMVLLVLVAMTAMAVAALLAVVAMAVAAMVTLFSVVMVVLVLMVAVAVVVVQVGSSQVAAGLEAGAEATRLAASSAASSPGSPALPPDPPLRRFAMSAAEPLKLSKSILSEERA